MRLELPTSPTPHNVVVVPIVAVEAIVVAVPIMVVALIGLVMPTVVVMPIMVIMPIVAKVPVVAVVPVTVLVPTTVVVPIVAVEQPGQARIYLMEEGAAIAASKTREAHQTAVTATGARVPIPARSRSNSSRAKPAVTTQEEDEAAFHEATFHEAAFTQGAGLVPQHIGTRDMGSVLGKICSLSSDLCSKLQGMTEHPCCPTAAHSVSLTMSTL